MKLEVHGLRKAYGALIALDDLSFEAGAGEVVGLLGPNGAGKTTAIRVLTTILAPSGGTFTVAGVPHTRPAEIRRRVGVLPESAGYPGQQTGAEFLRFHARLFGHSRASAGATAGELLDQVGLADRGSMRISAYSRGMRQRLGIARALVNDPEVVFFDEPTLGLDPAGQRQVLALIEAIARERRATVLLSTHFLGEVEDTCSRVLILNRGRVVAAGTVSEVTRRAAAPRGGAARRPLPGPARTAGGRTSGAEPGAGARCRPPAGRAARLAGRESRGRGGERGRARARRRGRARARFRARGRSPQRRIPGDDRR